MSKPKEKEEALRLRIEERKSYNEIQDILGVSKGTLSLWLADYPLSEDEIKDRSKIALTGNTYKKGKFKNKYTQCTDNDISKYCNVCDISKLSTTAKGRIAECAVLFRLALLNLEVYSSIFDGSKIDMIIEIPNGALVKIQVKWLTKPNRYGLPSIKLKCSDGRKASRRYKNTEFDYIVGYDIISDVCYIFSQVETSEYKTAITVSDESAENWKKIIYPEICEE